MLGIRSWRKLKAKGFFRFRDKTGRLISPYQRYFHFICTSWNTVPPELEVMGTKSKKLIALVASFTTNERGYYIKFVSAIAVGSQKKSVAMFRQILRALRHGGVFKPSPNHLPRVSHYLYYSLLRSLENYKRNKTPMDRILVLCRQAKIVADRGLIGQSHGLAAKAADECTEAGLHSLQPVVMHLQRSNLLATGQTWGSRAMRHHADESHAIARAHFHGALALHAHTRLAALHHHSGMALCPEGRTHWQHSFEAHTQELDAQWLDHEGHAHLLMAQALLAHGLGQRHAAIHMVQGLLRSMRFATYPPSEAYLQAHASQLLHRLCMHAGRHLEAQHETTALHACAEANRPVHNPNERATLTITHQLQLLALHTHTRPHYGTLEGYRDAYAQLHGRELPVGAMAQFHITAMAHHVYKHEPREALHHFNALMNHRKARTYHRTLTISAQLLSLAAHHALCSEGLLDSTVASLRRRLWKKNHQMPLSGMVGLLTRHYAQCPDVHSTKAHTHWQQQLRSALVAYREKEPEGYAEAGFDWVGYLGGENVAP